MFVEAPQIANGINQAYDICVVGGGPAGIVLALKLMKSGRQVCLIEAGGLEPDYVGDDHPFQGYNVGRPYDLATTRLRYFGGSSGHWGGWCRPLDDIDFSPKRFARHMKGWPIARRSLDRFYREASAWCEIFPHAYELDEFDLPSEKMSEFYDTVDPAFRTRVFRFSPPTQFGTVYRSQVDEAQNLDCWLNSTVVNLVRSGSRVERVDVKSNERSFSIEADYFVLATGGIETPRLLLASNKDDPRGIGNDSDFVGRCFSDHLDTSGARILSRRPFPYMEVEFEDIWMLPHLSLSDNWLLQNQYPNFGALVKPNNKELLIGQDYLRSIESLYSANHEGEAQLTDLNIRFEPTPNPDSRITLTNQYDHYGLPRVQLDWRLNDFEFDAMKHVLDDLARLIGASGLGRMQTIYRDTPTTRQRGAQQAHHLGTTRMSDDQSTGVVDPNSKVFDIDNLFIVGSSVFPSFGFANPTLTIVALACRLGEHLTKLVSQ